MTEHEGHAHEHHWEWSYFPLILVLGIFLLLPITFALAFVYELAMYAMITGVLGLLLVLVGVAGWTSEALANADNETGWSLTGLPMFIVSEVLIFLSLFSSYWLIRLSADVWPPEGSPEISVGLPIIMTILLVSSSLTYHAAEVKLEEGNKGGFNMWLLISIALGSVFLYCTYYEYSHLLHGGWGWSADAKSTAFYSITGFHASHVLIGLAMFIVILIPALAGKVSHTLVKGAGMYWHFVDVVWFFVVSQIYFW